MRTELIIPNAYETVCVLTHVKQRFMASYASLVSANWQESFQAHIALCNNILGLFEQSGDI